MKKLILALPSLLLLTHCASGPGGGPLPVGPVVSFGRQVEIINVSSYDPKQRTRNGVGFSEHDVSALRANGASGLIARAGKGGNLDRKCANFLASADRVGLLPGVYYRVQRHVSATRQADQFVDRVLSLSRMRSWNAPSLLLCGDYDGDLSLAAILEFMDRVESRTGVVPVAYLENSPQLKLQTRSADSATKARLARAPYWLALYSHTSGDGPIFPAPGSPRGLLDQYRLWRDWTLWQYGGVDWERGAPSAKVYSHGSDRWPLYFGNLDRPVERNVFRGSQADLVAFWQRHGLRLR